MDQLSLEQLNKVPQGFNNNIVWNLGHIISAQQGVCYLRAGVEMRIDPVFQATFRPGTKPERFFGEEDVQQIKALMLPTLDILEDDLKTDLFANYPTWTTRYGATINNIDDAVAFLPFHDGLHTGVINAMCKLV